MNKPPDVVRDVLSARGESGGDTQAAWRRDKDPGGAHRRGQNRANCGRDSTGGQEESIFHPDSYGHRPRKSAHDALKKCRERCWRKDWVLDLDIRKFFDSLDHDLVIKTVEANTADKWVFLYVKRWLKAPLQLPDGTRRERDKGTPQGSAVSPVLANLFLHYAFDMFLGREFPTVEFGRYADDGVPRALKEVPM